MCRDYSRFGGLLSYEDDRYGTGQQMPQVSSAEPYSRRPIRSVDEVEGRVGVYPEEVALSPTAPASSASIAP
jgi:hypothetical protein